ncbi:hypothetical protein ACA910_003362 [Epithemia clementina (nom. ined.)]
MILQARRRHYNWMQQQEEDSTGSRRRRRRPPEPPPPDDDEPEPRLPLQPPEQRPINVVLLGNSFLRQVWESIACQYSSLITNGFFSKWGSQHGYRIGKGSALGSRRAPKFSLPKSSFKTSGSVTVPPVT